MSTTVLFVGVVVFAFVAGRLLDRFATRAFAVTGVEYLLLGILLGPVVLGILDHEVLRALDLFVSTVLGVVGFLVGLEIRNVRGGTEPFLAGLSSAGAVAVVLAGLAAASFQWLDPPPPDAIPWLSEPITATADTLVLLWVSPETLWIGLSIGAAASTSSTVLIDAALSRGSASAERATLLRTMATTAQVVAIFMFGVALAGSRATSTAIELGLTLVEWSTIIVLSAGFTGLLFTVFLGREDDPMRLLVATVGVIVFAAGIGTALGVSPLFANLVAGMALALTSKHADALEAALRPLRFPATVLVLLLAGAAWVPATGRYWLLVPAYVLVRAVARLTLSRAAVSTFLGDASIAQGIGQGLLGQGVLASAISLAFAQHFPELAGPVTTTIIGGVVLTDLFAMFAMRRYLADAGEVKVLRQPETPPATASAGEPADAHVHVQGATTTEGDDHHA